MDGDEHADAHHEPTPESTPAPPPVGTRRRRSRGSGRAPMRLAFASAVTALGVVIAAGQYFTAVQANDRDSDHIYRNLAKECLDAIADFYIDAKVASWKIYDELTGLDLSIVDQTPAYNALLLSGDRLTVCRRGEGDYIGSWDSEIGTAEEVIALLGGTWQDIAGHGAGGVDPTGEDLSVDRIKLELTTEVAELISPMFDTMTDASSAYLYGPDWRSKTAD